MDQRKENTHSLMVRSNNALTKVCNEYLEGLHAAGIHKVERQLECPQGTAVVSSGKPRINFCANNYLGLANHPRVAKAAKDMIDTHGFGMASVRIICGTSDKHKELERKISEFNRMDDTVLYPSCFDANGGLFEALLNDEDCVISDALNHASIIDGIRICKAERLTYKHLDMKDLENQLKQSMDKRIRLIATDSVFSMDGDLAPLPEIVALAKKYDAITFIDECHATGVYGPNGRGMPEYFGIEGQIDIVNSTLGKGLSGGTGGYTSASFEVCELLRLRSRPYLYSNSIVPSVVGASLEVFKMLEEDQSIVKKMKANVKLFRTKMEEAGFNLMGHCESPICPVFLKDSALSAIFEQKLMKEYNIFVFAVYFPVVPRNRARIRCSVSAGHSTEQIEETIAAFIAVGRELGVIPTPAKM